MTHVQSRSDDESPTEPELRVPVRKAKTISLRRGGRLGVTIETNEVIEGFSGHLFMAATGVFVAGFGWFAVPGLLGEIVAIGGAFLTGVAIDRAVNHRGGEIVDLDGFDFDDGGGDDDGPAVYDADGNPARLRVVGAEYVGEVSGEGHYGFELSDEDGKATVYFEGVDR